MKRVVILLSFLLCSSTFATERIGRLGIGFTNQVKNGTPSLSFKLQKSKSFAFGGFFGIDTSDNGGWDAGLKLYRNVFDEPFLTFYAHAMGALINKKTSAIEDKSGFQFDIGMGSEFSFQGLQSLGFSLEFGISLYKLDDFSIQTKADNFIVGSVHFYSSHLLVFLAIARASVAEELLMMMTSILVVISSMTLPKI
jgi:hypothetical protein